MSDPTTPKVVTMRQLASAIERGLLVGPDDAIESADAIWPLLPEAEAELRAMTRERDLAVAHDRQPYPTAWAYEQAMATCHRLRDALTKYGQHLPGCSWFGPPDTEIFGVVHCDCGFALTTKPGTPEPRVEEPRP